MYEPKDRENPKYIVFLKLDGRILPGVGLKCLGATLAALLLGAALTVATGAWTEEVEVPLSAAEQLVAVQGLESERDALAYGELRSEAAALEAIAEPTRAQADRLREAQAEVSKLSAKLSAVKDRTLDELESDARAHGVGASFDDARLEALAETSRTETVEAVPAWARAAVLAVVPAVLAFLFTVEQQGRSLASEIAAKARYRRRPKVYTYRRIHRTDPET